MAVWTAVTGPYMRACLCSNGNSNWQQDGGYYFERGYSSSGDDHDSEARFTSQLGSGSSEERGSQPGSAGRVALPKPTPMLLTCLVMEYCAGGTLNQAIQRGVFYCDGVQQELHEVRLGGWVGAGPHSMNRNVGGGRFFFFLATVGIGG